MSFAHRVVDVDKIINLPFFDVGNGLIVVDTVPVSDTFFGKVLNGKSFWVSFGKEIVGHYNSEK